MKTADRIEQQAERKSSEAAAPQLKLSLKPKADRRGDVTRIAKYQFKPGQSGNPGGQPKHDISREIAQAIFANNQEMIYKAYCKILSKGNAYAFQVLAERAFGKMKESMELSGAGGGPLEFRHMSDEDLERQCAELMDKLGLVERVNAVEREADIKPEAEPEPRLLDAFPSGGSVHKA